MNAIEAHRRNGLIMEARDRALRAAHQRVAEALGEIRMRNYGLAEDALRDLFRDLDDENGPPALVLAHAEALGL